MSGEGHTGMFVQLCTRAVRGDVTLTDVAGAGDADVTTGWLSDVDFHPSGAHLGTASGDGTVSDRVRRGENLVR